MSGGLGVGLGVVATGAAADAVARHVPTLVGEGFASRLFGRDATLWGAGAEPDAAQRWGWVGVAESSRSLADDVQALRKELESEGIDHVVLCGMGGSSLAAEVICATAGVELTVLDSSDPDQVRGASEDRLDRTVVVVSSPSGSTVETDAQRRVFETAFTAIGVDPASRLVVVTDAGSPLDRTARDEGHRVFHADPQAGGRCSALTAFGLVPSGLAGADLHGLLDQAAAATEVLGADQPANPGLRLGAAMAGTSPLRDKLVLVDHGSGIAGLPGWAEQLVAESTGKGGAGVLPVVVEGLSAPEVVDPSHDATIVHLVASAAGADDSASDDDTDDSRSSVAVAGSLGAQLVLWEVATAVAARLLGVNPFDRPDLESAQVAARSRLEAPGEAEPPDFTDGPVSVQARGGDWLEDAGTLSTAVDRLLDQVDGEHGYLAVMVYLDRHEHASLEQARSRLARKIGRPVTFGWGPRFLHSTGQFHKGGPPVGVYLQVTGSPRADLPVPGRELGFATLIAAQAAGDATVLADHGRPVLRVHLDDPLDGLSLLSEALS